MVCGGGELLEVRYWRLTRSSGQGTFAVMVDPNVTSKDDAAGKDGAVGLPSTTQHMSGSSDVLGFENDNGS